jgi:flagellar biosynthesis component FlhA
VLRVKEIEAGRGQLRPPLPLAIDPSGQVPPMAGERTVEPTFGLPALWIGEALREEALARGCTVVDATGVLATHLTETVREHMAELLSFAETQKLLDELPREHQKLVSDLIPSQIGMGGLQRVLQALLAERVSIRDLPTILEGVQEATAGGSRSIPGILAVVRARLARQLSDAARGPQGYVPLIALSPGWEIAFRIPGRPAGGAAARHGSLGIAGIHAAPTRMLRFRRRGGGGAGAGLLRRHPRPCAGHRRTPPPRDHRVEPDGDPPPRPHPHRREPVTMRNRKA